MERDLDTSKATGLDLYSMHTSCLLAYDSKDRIIGLHMARLMTVKSDGLNHQGGVFFMYNSDDFSRVPDRYQV